MCLRGDCGVYPEAPGGLGAGMRMPDYLFYQPPVELALSNALVVYMGYERGLRRNIVFTPAALVMPVAC